MVCRIIGRFRNTGIMAVKLSPHFHEPSPGLEFIDSGKGYKIFEESNKWSAKDTSRMLQSGAGRVLYGQVDENGIEAAFGKIIGLLPPGMPIIVESPSLIKYFEPGVFVIMIGSDRPGRDLSEIEHFTHLNCTVDELDRTKTVPFSFIDGEWGIE
jgi:hypothetical protein